MDVQLPSSPVPLFPLPGVFLFPHQMLPLHVFEPRYRQLVSDLLDGAGRFVIGTPAALARASGQTTDILPVAGLGEILRHEKRPDGRFHIWVLGLVRVRIREGKRFTVFDVDAQTAERWGEAMAAWGRRQPK